MRKGVRAKGDAEANRAWPADPSSDFIGSTISASEDALRRPSHSSFHNSISTFNHSIMVTVYLLGMAIVESFGSGVYSSFGK